MYPPITFAHRTPPTNRRRRNADGDFTVHPFYEERKEWFMQWLALPKRDRHPRSLRKVADLLGVSRQTMYRWRRDVEGYVRRRQRVVLEQYVESALHALGLSASFLGKEGNADRRLFFQLMGWEEDRTIQEEQAGPTVFFSMSMLSDERLIALYMNVARELLPRMAQYVQLTDRQMASVLGDLQSELEQGLNKSKSNLDGVEEFFV